MGVINLYPTTSNPSANQGNDKRNLPDQTVSWAKKQTDSWKEDCMDFFSTMWMAGNPRRNNKLINYRLVNGIFNFNALKSEVDKMFSDGDGIDEYSENFEHYPICTLPLKSLWGEEAERPFNFKAKAEDSENQSEFFRTKADLLHQYVMSQIKAKIDGTLQQQGIDPKSKEGQQAEQQMTPKEIEALMRRDGSTTVEKAANGILSKLQKELLLTEKFIKGWKDVTIVAEEFYWIGTINNKPVIEVINPLSIVYDKGYELEYIDESEWVCRGEYMTPSQIISRYKDFLTDAEVKRISVAFRDDGQSGSGANTGANMMELNTEWGFNSSQTMTDSMYPLDPNSNFMYDNFNNGGFYGYNGTSYIGTRNHVLVLHAEWRSKRKLAELTSFDENGQEVKNIIDGEFKLSKEMISAGYTIRYFWIDEVWEGTKISKDVYVKIEPKSNQYRSYYNIEKVRLGYTGMVYNNRNAPPTSILDEMKQYQTLYNIIMNKLKDDFNSELGQLLLMDITQVPTKHNFDMGIWLKWIKKMKIVMVDPTAEGVAHNFNQFNTINATMAQSIQSKIELLNFLEQKCWSQAGFSSQRLGDISASETATGTNAALAKSYAQTNDLFRSHNNVKARVLNNLLEEAKIAYSGKIEQTYFLDDLSTAFIKIDGKDLMFADLAVYVADNAKDLQNLAALKQLASPALQAGATLADVADIITEDSMSVIKEKLRIIRENQEALQQQQQQIEEQKLEQATKLAQDTRDWQADQNQKDRDKDIYVAELKALGTASIANTAVEPDILGQAQLALEEQKHIADQAFKHTELAHKNALENKKIDMEGKRLAADERIAKIKAETALKVKDKQNSKKK